MAMLQDVKDDGTAYPRYQPAPQLAPVRPLGISTPMYGTPQAPLLPIQQRGQTTATPTTAATLPAPPRPKPGLQQDQNTAPETPATPPTPPSGPTLPPPPPPVGSVGGPMVQPPAPTAPGGAPATTGTGAAITPITPGGANDLRYAMISGNDPRLGTTQGMVDTAAATVANAPDRQALAAQAFQLLRDQTEPQFQMDQRTIGQNAAKFGRIGAGMTTNELTSLDQARERDLLNAQRGLSLDAAGSTLSDRLNQLGALSGLEGQQFGQGQASRGELRGERSYQDQIDQQARDNEIQTRMLEDQLLNSQFGRDQSRAALEAQIGFGQDPAGTLMQQGGYYGDQANASGSSTADLLNLWYQSQRPPAGATPGIVAPAPTGTPYIRPNEG